MAKRAIIRSGKLDVDGEPLLIKDDDYKSKEAVCWTTPSSGQVVGSFDRTNYLEDDDIEAVRGNGFKVDVLD